MGTFETSVVVNGSIYVAGDEIPDAVMALITNPNLVGGIVAGGDEAAALGDEGVQSVEQVVEWVGGDPGRAQEALDWEHEARGDEPRVTLVRALQEVLTGTAE